MKSPITLTYISIRKYVGILAMSIPIVISLSQLVFFGDGLRGSISAYYHTSMGWFFVSALCFIGFFLVVLYQGYDNWDRLLAVFAGMFAFTTAFLPTDPFGDDPAKQAIIRGFSQDTATTIHGVSAACMFIIVGIFMLFRFTKCEHGRNNIFQQCEHDTREKKKRNRVYRICGGIIFAAIIILGLEILLKISFSPFTVFIGEFVILLSFGFAWAVKGEILWKDTDPSKGSRRFNELQSRQVDGYRSGMWIFFLLISIWFTVVLFSAQTAPFTLFAEEGSESETGASVETITLSGEETQAATGTPSEDSAGAAKTPKIKVLNPEVLNVQYKPTEEEQVNITDRIEVELTISNTSDDPINLNFDALFTQPCREESESRCVQINDNDIRSFRDANNIQTPGEYESFKVSFPKENISGQILIIAGDSISIVPFSVTVETPVLGFYKSKAREILTWILFVLVAGVLYFFLDNQVFALFWPLVRRNFRVELGNTETEKKENGELWTLFSNQVNDLNVHPGFSVNPRAESTISAPSSMTPDNSYLKILFELVNWIFPRLGYSMRMTKLNSKKLGAGLSVAISKNDRRENIAEKVFWASDYDIMDAENEGDLRVHRLLMIPTYFWFADVVDGMDGFEPNEHTWEANAYYRLGDSLWHSDIDKGINYYVKSINLDPENWPAYAALGRVWAEKSQDEKSAAFSKEYLLLANNYLKTAIDGLRNTKELDDVYFGALYNQVVVLLYLLDKNLGSKEAVLLKGNMVKKEALSGLRMIQDGLSRRIPYEITHNNLWENVSQYWDEGVDTIKDQAGRDKLVSALVAQFNAKPPQNWQKPWLSIYEQELRNLKFDQNQVYNIRELKYHNIYGCFEDVLDSDKLKDLDRAINILTAHRDLLNTQITKINDAKKINQSNVNEKLKSDRLATWLIDYLQALEFVLQIIELKNAPIENIDNYVNLRVVPKFTELPYSKEPIDMDHPLTQENKWHFARSHYRVQFNAACFYSMLASKAKVDADKKRIINLALDHIEMALGVGGGLVQFAKKDSALKAISKEKRFRILTEPSPQKAREMEESKLHVVHYKGQKEDAIDLLPGVSEETVKKFADLGIATRNDLLKNGADAKGRDDLVKKTKVDSKLLIWWLNLCDLMRVSGLTLEAAIALEGRGNVDTVKELRRRKASSLHSALGGMFPKELLQIWIDESKELAPILEY